MNSKISLTLVISYYKALDNLKLILKALNDQSASGFEVIISEDDNNAETLNFIAENYASYNFPLVHLNQNKDLGFRKNEMLNKSIKASKSEFMVFIDGDCVPHKHLVKQYLKNVDQDYIYWGRRVLLSESFSSAVLKEHALQKLHFQSLLFSDSKKLKDAIYSPLFSWSFKEKGLKGCNWGIKKQHLLDINGFDEDYIRAGVGEDDDVEWRLKAAGFTKKSMKNKAIVFHLYHPRAYSNEGVEKNNVMLNLKKKSNAIKCHNGLKKLE